MKLKGSCSPVDKDIEMGILSPASSSGVPMSVWSDGSTTYLNPGRGSRSPDDEDFILHWNRFSGASSTLHDHGMTISKTIKEQ